MATSLALVAALGWSLVLAATARADERADLAGPWEWPLDAPHEVARPFEPPAHRYGTGHRGLDLVGAPGVSVRAAGSGRVSWSGLLAGRGVVVVVHGALRTTYEPVDERVGAGTVVEVGDVLGVLASGHLGCPSAACLHWGLRRGDEYLDPLSLLGRGPVRLLPLEGPVVRGPGPGVALRSTGAATHRSTSAGTAGGRSGPAHDGSPAGADADRPAALSRAADRLNAGGQAGAEPGQGSGERPPWPAVGAGALALAAAGAARGRTA